MTPPGGWTQALIEHLGIEPWRIPIVILSAAGIYLTFLILVRVFGVRVLTGWSGFDAVVLVMLGSVAGRVILGHPPTLATGVIGLTTLLVLEAVFGTVHQVAGARRTPQTRPRVLLAHGRFVPQAMRRSHLTPPEVDTALRRAGLSRRAQAQCVILESTGALSVLRAGEPVDPEMLDGVIGAELVLDPSEG